MLLCHFLAKKYMMVREFKPSGLNGQTCLSPIRQRRRGRVVWPPNQHMFFGVKKNDFQEHKEHLHPLQCVSEIEGKIENDFGHHGGALGYSGSHGGMALGAVGGAVAAYIDIADFFDRHGFLFA